MPAARKVSLSFLLLQRIFSLISLSVYSQNFNLNGTVQDTGLEVIDHGRLPSGDGTPP